MDWSKIISLENYYLISILNQLLAPSGVMVSIGEEQFFDEGTNKLVFKLTYYKQTKKPEEIFKITAEIEPDKFFGVSGDEFVQSVNDNFFAQILLHTDVVPKQLPKLSLN